MGLEANGRQELEINHASAPAARGEPAKPRRAPCGAGRGTANPRVPALPAPPGREEPSPEGHEGQTDALPLP